MIWLFCQSGLLKFAPRILDFPGLFYSTRGAAWRRPGPRFRLFLSHGFVEQTPNCVKIRSGSGPP